MMARMPWWAWVWPLLAWGLLAATFVRGTCGAVVVAAGLRRHGLAGALRRLYLRADRAASRLFPAGPGDRSGRGRGGACAATVRRCGARQPRAAVDLPRGGGGLGQGADTRGG